MLVLLVELGMLIVMLGIEKNNSKIDVFISDKYLLEYISRWLNSKADVRKKIGNILVDLICEDGDCVYLHQFNKELFCLDVVIRRNGKILDENVKIYLLNLESTIIIVSIDNDKRVYECLRDSRGRLNREYNLIREDNSKKLIRFGGRKCNG